MKSMTPTYTLRIGLPLVAGLALLMAPAGAAPTGPLAALSARIQDGPLGTPGKNLSVNFAATPAMSALRGKQHSLTGVDTAPKHFVLDPLTTLPPVPGNRVPVQLRRLSRSFGKAAGQNAKPKQIGTQLSAAPSWK